MDIEKEEKSEFYMELMEVVGKLSKVYSEKDIELTEYFNRERKAADERGELGIVFIPNACPLVRNENEIKKCVLNIRESYAKILKLLYGNRTPDYVNEEAVEGFEELKAVETLANYMREHGDNLEPAIAKVCDNKLYGIDESAKVINDTREDYAQIKAIFQNRSM